MKKTKLNSAHKKLSAKMVEFAGYEMPIRYKSVIKEHLAVREGVGIFDVSHMGEILIEGKEAEDMLNYLTANDVSKLKPGRIHYNAILTEKGTFVDDLLVYKLDEGKFLLVVNASNKDKDFRWLKEHGEKFNASIVDLSDDYTQIAIQGPKAQELLENFVNQDLSTIKYYRFKEMKVMGKPAIVSRTGYTGEDGFEVYFKVNEEEAEKFWFALLSEGKAYGILPCGLGARDSLRLEAKMALYGNDIDETTTVLEADLGWILKLYKPYFMGKEILEKQAKEGVERKLIGFEMKDREIPRHGNPVYVGDKKISEVTSGGFAPYLKKNIGLTYLPVEFTDIGTEFFVEVHSKKAKAVVVKTPFYSRKKN